MLLHQSIGLERFNELPRQKAVHALFECCCSLTWAGWVSDGRPFADHAEILSRAEDAILNLGRRRRTRPAMPSTGRRP